MKEEIKLLERFIEGHEQFISSPNVLNDKETVSNIRHEIEILKSIISILNEENLVKAKKCECLPEGESKKYTTLCVCAKCGLPD